MQKKSHKSNINIYNKDNNNRTKKTKKSPKIQHILNDHHQKPGKIPFRSEAKVDLAKEFHSWDYYSHSYAKKIKKIYNELLQQGQQQRQKKKEKKIEKSCSKL